MLLHTHQTVLWLNVSMDDIARVNIVKTINELVGEHQHYFKRELTTVKVEEIFQT